MFKHLLSFTELNLNIPLFFGAPYKPNGLAAISVDEMQISKNPYVGMVLMKDE